MPRQVNRQNQGRVECLICQTHYRDIWDHWRKNHLTETGSPTYFLRMGLVQCNRCYCGFVSAHGVRTHQGKGGCTAQTQPLTNAAAGPSQQRQLRQQLRATSLRPRGRSLIPTSSLDSSPSSASSRRRNASRSLSRERQRSFSRSPLGLHDLSRTEQPSSGARHIAEAERLLNSLNTSVRDGLQRQDNADPQRPQLQRPEIEEIDLTVDEPSLPAIRIQQQQTQSPLITPERLLNAETFQLNNRRLQRFLKANEIKMPDLRIHSKYMEAFANTAARMARNFTLQPNEENLLHFLLIPKMGLAQGLLRTDASVSVVLRNYPNQLLGEAHDSDQPRAQVNRFAEVRSELTVQDLEEKALFRAKRLVEKGFISRAASALAKPAGVAANSHETKRVLIAKHLQGPTTPFATLASPAPSLPATAADVLRQIKTFDEDTAAGVSGWTVPMLKEALQREDVVNFVVSTLR